MERHGWRERARNVRLANGEIDLVMRDGDTEVFVEVKARREGAGKAAASVGPDKRRRVAAAAAAWIAREGLAPGGCRFDVVTVTGPGPRLTLWPNAFEAPPRFDV